jgi:hypothetical protein
VRNIVAASAVTCGLITAAIPLAGEASAACDAVDCVPNVARNVGEGAPCEPRPSYVFGLDSDRNTLICAATGVWVRTGPLIGTRQVALPCERKGDTAQQPLAGNDLQPVRTPGIPLMCAEMNGALRWVHF